MTVRFNVGDLVTVASPTFVVGTTPTDPATVTLTVTKPDGTSTTYTYAGAQVARVSTGVYSKQVTADQAGLWNYVWTGTGTAADVQDGSFDVWAAGDSTVYAQLNDVKAFIGINDTSDDVMLSAALLAASRVIDGWCGRRFYPDITATPRQFAMGDTWRLALNADFYTTSGLVIASDFDSDGIYETTWATTDYILEPVNGILDGIAGWPYDTIRAIMPNRFPVWTRSDLVQVTAKWGWAAVPEPIRMAAMLLAKDLFKNKDTVGGVLGTDQFGAVRVRQDPLIMTLIQPYQRFGFA